MKRQWAKEGKAIRKIVTGMMLGAAMCFSVAACGPGDLTDIETSTNSVETVMGETEDAATAPSVQETEETTEETTESMDVSIWGEYTNEASGDWNKDGSRDQLRIYSQEMEGSEYLIGIQLSISGRPSYLFQASEVISFEDFLKGDFDGDGELEYAVVFDIHAQGANGGYGLLLLDYENDQWIEITDLEPCVFTGFSYDVVTDVAAGGYRVIGKDSGQEHFIAAEDVLEEDGSDVTAFSLWAVVDGEDQDYLELWQYVAGGHKINHIGDVVTTSCIQNGKLTVVEEKVTQELLAYDICLARTMGRTEDKALFSGEYYVRLINHAGMVIESAPEHDHYEELKTYGAFWVPFEMDERIFLSTGLEDAVELSVYCSYDEFVKSWETDQLYELDFGYQKRSLTINCAREIESEVAFPHRWSGIFYQITSQGNQLEIYPVEFVRKSNEQRLKELMQQGWDLDKVFFDDMYGYYEFPYETEKQTVSLAEDARYYAIVGFGAVPITRDESRIDETDYQNDYRLVIRDGVVECVIIYWIP